MVKVRGRGNYENVSWHKFFNVCFLQQTILTFTFGFMSFTPLANLLIFHVNFLQCKLNILNIDMVKYNNCENTNESLVFLGWIVPTRWVSWHPTYLYWIKTTKLYSILYSVTCHVSCHVSCVMCHMSHITWHHYSIFFRDRDLKCWDNAYHPLCVMHVSCVTCHMVHVTGHGSKRICGSSWGRVCYQRALLRLVLHHILQCPLYGKIYCTAL